MKKIYFFILLGVISFSNRIAAQTIEINNPPAYGLIPSDSLQSLVEVYTNLEALVLADIDWLNYNYVNENNDLRAEKNNFVLMWMSGSPTISIQVDDRIVTFLKADPSVLLAYMMGWTKYSLEHDYSNDLIDCTYAGVSNAVSFYTRNRQFIKKNKEMELYKAMSENKTLYRYVAEILTR